MMPRNALNSSEPFGRSAPSNPIDGLFAAHHIDLSPATRYLHMMPFAYN
jgi:hypothetical protein